MNQYGIGIDIGSTSAKTIVLERDSGIVERILQPTGYSSVETAMAIHESLEQKGFISAASFSIVATGYGRVSVPFADKSVKDTYRTRKGMYRKT